MAPGSAHPVGKAVIVYGTVKAVSANGFERVLAPNSVVYANERIVTGPDGSVSIQFTGNSTHLDLGRMSDVAIDEDVYSTAMHGSQDGALSVEDIQTALENDPNFDPTTNLEAPAAGGAAAIGTGARGGGRQIVVFAADQLEVMPDSGAETTGIEWNFLDPPPGGELVHDDAVTLNHLPVVDPVAVRISEEGLGGAHPDGPEDAADTAYITGSISAVDPDGDTLSYTFASVPAGLTSNGVGIVWSGVGTGTLVGMVGGATILTATIDAGGHYTVALAGPIDHASQGEDQLDLVFGLHVSDGSGTVATTFTVTVEDDMPVLGAFDSGMLPSQNGTVSGQFELDPGADGIDHFEISGPVIANVKYLPPERLADGTTILHAYSTVDGTEIFSLTVRPDGTYIYELINAEASYPQTFDAGDFPVDIANWLETTNGEIELTTKSTSTINSTSAGFGVGSDVADTYVGAGEYFVLEFHYPGTAGDDSPLVNTQFVDSVTLTVSELSGSGGTYSWTAVNSVTGVTESGTIFIDSEGNYTIDPTISFNLLKITGGADLASSGTHGEDYVGAQFSSVTLSHHILSDDALLSFDISAVDNDNDVTAAQSLAIQLVPLTPPGQGGVVPERYILTDTDGSNHWFGSSDHMDIITGSEHGFDVVDYSDSTGAVSVNLNESGHAHGDPAVFNSPGEGEIGGGDATHDTLNSIDGIVGGQGDDILFGNSHSNYFDGGAGKDTIDSGDGNDTVVYDGADVRIDGGDGVGDTLVIKGAAHIDLSQADQSQGDDADVRGFEHVDASASQAAVELIGDGHDNTLIGGAGNDTLDGGSGNDTLTGGKGADTFMVSDDNTLITDYNRGEGDVVDISHLLADADRSNLAVGTSADGHAQLSVLDSGGTEIGSVTFETIDNSGGSLSLDSLLSHVEVKDSHGTV